MSYIVYREVERPRLFTDIRYANDDVRLCDICTMIYGIGGTTVD
ncbi:MAG: hypothetical protein H6Q54_178 [Deltaproteobacteria bacterium]|nr:hypothetical protein [Deltaproteobacteria bacterium]